VFHSGYGHTERVAESVCAGARRVANTEVALIPVAQLGESSSRWADLDAADAIIFGAPTYMGSVSAEMKRFIEATSKRWQALAWADKLAAGFTNSGSQEGDKHNTLVSFATLAAQQGMVWINLNLLPGNNHSKGSVEDLNRLGASLGVMTQSNIDQGPEVCPPQSDLRTAEHLGERVASCTHRWLAGKAR
jgi:multimeric flavodoxin WrbA